MIAHRMKENYISEIDRSKAQFYRQVGDVVGWGNVGGGILFGWFILYENQLPFISSYPVPICMILIGLFSVWIGKTSLGGQVKEHLYAFTYLMIPLIVLYFIEEAAVTFWSVIFLYLTVALILHSTMLVIYALFASLTGLLLVMFLLPDELTVSIGMQDHLTRLVFLAIAAVFAFYGLHFGKRKEKSLFHYINQAEEMAFQDPLLKIPNRVDFNLYVDHTLRVQELVVGKIEISQFQSVYDVLGHQKSDVLLNMVSERLTAYLDRPSYLAKGEGSLFLIAFHNVITELNAGAYFDGMLTALSKPYHLDKHEYHLSFNIGAASSEADGQTSDELMRHAQFALEAAKNQGMNQIVFCSEGLKQEAMNRVRISEALYQADIEDEFHLVYQPQVNLKTNEVVGMEALVRWNHPELGFIPPNIFIEIAEKNGFIVSLGKWILEKACKEVQLLNKKSAEPMKLAVNVSFIEMQRKDYVEETLRILKKTDFPPEQLEIELTERSLFENRPEDLRRIELLKSHGIRIAIDDFGTGYSSFGILAKINVDKIKVPREFIDHVDIHPNHQRIVETIISVAERFRVTCLAEGVEREEESNFLQDQICQEVQGYFYARPAIAQEIETWLKDWPEQAETKTFAETI